MCVVHSSNLAYPHDEAQQSPAQILTGKQRVYVRLWNILDRFSRRLYFRQLQRLAWRRPEKAALHLWTQGPPDSFTLFVPVEASATWL